MATKCWSILCVAGLVACGGVEPNHDAGDGTVSKETEHLNPYYFSGWTELSGLFTEGPPAVISQWSDSYREKDVYVHGGNNDVWINYWSWFNGTDYGWSGWEDMGAPPSGGVTSAPSVTTSWSFDTHDYSALAVRGPSTGSCPHCIYVEIVEHGQTPSWYAVPGSGSTYGDPILVVTSGYLYLFADESAGGTSNAYYYTRNSINYGYSNSGWASWQEVPGSGVFRSDPSAVATYYGLVLVGNGTDNELYATSLYDGTWDGYWWWQWTDSYFYGRPGVASVMGWDLELFGRNVSDDQVEEGSVEGDNGAWDGWYELTSGAPSGGFTAAGCGAFAPVDGHVDVAAQDQSGTVWVNSY